MLGCLTPTVQLQPNQIKRAKRAIKVKGKRRPVVVLNNGVVMAESSAGGVIRLRK